MENLTNGVLYEIGVKFDPMMIIPVILAVIILSIPPILGLFYKKHKNSVNIRAIHLINIISVCLTLIIITVTAFFAIKSVNEYKALMNAYQNKEYLTVSGYVEDFMTSENSNGEESFRIEDINFSYSPGFDYGYNVTSKNGGVITGNGQYLKIGYVEYNGKNKIVYIEQIQK